ncbi:MAG: septum formation initiator family protein [Rhodospirillales bacterium]|nr:septum formation initiator family protein [Rhodospirillales bacterium]
MTGLLIGLVGRFGKLLPQLIGLGVFAYFAFHFVQGERGVRAYAKLGQELEAAWAEEASLRDDLQIARDRVNALSAKSLDPDLLEERAQAVLNYARPKEVMIILPDSEAAGWDYQAN